MDQIQAHAKRQWLDTILGWALNLAIVVLCIFLGYLVGRRRSSPPVAAAPYPVLRPGIAFPLPKINWSTYHRTVVFVLSDQCHFCTQSAPFYRSLGQAVKQLNDVHLLAILPHPREESVAYLQRIGLANAQFVQGTPPSVGARGTPTVVVVDKSGNVVNLWSGILASFEEREVLGEIGVPQAADSPEGKALWNSPTVPETITTSDLKRIMVQNKRAYIVDLRNRAEFVAGHDAASKNIPVDELSTRAPAEIDRAEPVVIDCYLTPGDVCSFARKMLVQEGFHRVSILYPSAGLSQ